MSERRKSSGGALSERTTIENRINSDAAAAAMFERLRSQSPLAAQIVEYFSDLKARVSAIRGVTVHPNLGTTVPQALQHPDPDWLLVEEYTELRDAIFEIGRRDDGHAQRQLAPAAQLAAVARGFYAGRLAQERRLLPMEPATETGLRVDKHLAGNRQSAAKAKAELASIWKAKGLEIARSKRSPSKAYSANDVAAAVREELAAWLPQEFERRGLEFSLLKHLPSVGTVRKAISAKKVGNIA